MTKTNMNVNVEAATFTYKQALEILTTFDLLLPQTDAALPSDSPPETLLDTPLKLRLDSRTVGRGDCFLAYKGVSSDAHQYIQTAVEQQVSLVILEDSAFAPKTCPYLLVRSGRAAWAVLEAAARLPQDGFGKRSHQVSLKSTSKSPGSASGDLRDRVFSSVNLAHLMGVTGTNGKTSTVWLAKQLLQLRGTPVSSIGTLGFYINGRHFETEHTTPDPPQLYGMLATALTQGCQHILMEVSSHAVAQEKLLPLRYSTCVFTSFSRDHLDFHATMEEYFECKWQLFTSLASPGSRKFIHCSVPLTSEHLHNMNRKELTVYGQDAKIRAKEWGLTHYCEYHITATSIADGSVIDLKFGQQSFELSVPLFAEHAIDNFVAAWLATEGYNDHTRQFPSLKQVPGRLEVIEVLAKGNLPLVIVDYAHTPDAIEKTLRVLRPLTKGRLWVVFGCGGDRDKGKRPLMAKAALSCADRVIVTSDNPRSEDPKQIIQDICSGIPTEQTSKVSVQLLRERAIAEAVQSATGDDVILLAGKGHETYQMIGKTKHHFDDREIARHYLASQI